MRSLRLWTSLGNETGTTLLVIALVWALIWTSSQCHSDYRSNLQSCPDRLTCPEPAHLLFVSWTSAGMPYCYATRALRQSPKFPLGYCALRRERDSNSHTPQ